MIAASHASGGGKSAPIQREGVTSVGLLHHAAHFRCNCPDHETQGPSRKQKPRPSATLL